MLHARAALAALFLALCACASAPPGKRLAAAEGFVLPDRGVAVLAVDAQLGRLTTRGHVAHDAALSEDAADGLQDALLAALRRDGVPARAAAFAPPGGDDPEAENARLRALLALGDLRVVVHEAGLAPHRSALAARPIAYPEALRAAAGADHVLVAVASGTYATRNRRLAQAAGTAMTVGVGVGYTPSSGGQYVVLGLYDLEADRLVWVHKDDFIRYSLRREDDRARIAKQLLAPLTEGAGDAE